MCLPPEHNAELAVQIRELRKQRHLSLDELASLCGMKGPNIAAIESGRKGLGAISIERLLIGLDAKLIIKLVPISRKKLQ